MLTDKERIFAMAVADGKTQTEAYRIAYDTKTDNINTIYVNSCKVAGKEEVKEYIRALRERKEETAYLIDINDINKRYNLIWDRIAACQEKGDDAAISRYMNIINKMTGTYVNISKDITEEKNPLKDLSMEDLKNILDNTTTD